MSLELGRVTGVANRFGRYAAWAFHVRSSLKGRMRTVRARTIRSFLAKLLSTAMAPTRAP